MAKSRTVYDIDEIEEILNLYKNKLRKEGKVLTEYKSKSLSNFNAKLVENNIKRRNGEFFTLYKYNFWAGKNKTTGEFNYGKKIIIQKNEELNKILTSNSNDVSLQDIISIVDKNIKNPNKMTSLLCYYFKKQRDKLETISNENIRLSNENKYLKDKITMMEDIYTNLFFNSQSPNNSLNDMLSFNKIHDTFVNEELENMFEDGLTRFKILANLDYPNSSTESLNSHYQLQSIIDFKKKKKQSQRLKELEDEGF